MYKVPKKKAEELYKKFERYMDYKEVHMSPEEEALFRIAEEKEDPYLHMRQVLGLPIFLNGYERLTDEDLINYTGNRWEDQVIAKVDRERRRKRK